ncbi:uroporphyrinogen-III C-methyltransferase [Alicyclobacillus macrosporangiidus]|uniref:uroporphyrinogen-III C-methyltransferase n=1 Tax=Alicyclobacillus macrosporangiidus TaxID=392015 RepID=UPI00068ABA1C|nr:uroporphyrinogen-III C-methyltransferase [Alicyclobacillus macrosporangiidus]
MARRRGWHATTGTVFLVGAGPGDAGLLTLRGRRALAEADAIVMDHLAPSRLLRYARPDAEVYDVGKEAGHHRVSQREIEALLIRLAKAGKTVVRLKGGDPFVFGRGAEEALALEAAGIPWQVVPGVTSALAVPAFAGIPVTVRGVAAGFTVVTGHECQSSSGIDWAGLAQWAGTLIILMGMGALQSIVDRLIAAGQSPDTPAAVIRWGTRAAQRTVRATLIDLPAAVRTAGLRNPAVIVIGEAAAQQPSLAWFERQPLFGRRVIVIGESSSITLEGAESLEALGAEAVDLPLASAAVVHRDAAAEWAASAMGSTGAEREGDHGRVVWWFRTAIGVETVWQALRSTGADARALARVYLVTEGWEAAEALAGIGLSPDVTLEQGADGEGVLPAEAGAVWLEAVDGLPNPVASVRRYQLAADLPAPRSLRLWQTDVAAIRLRLQRMLADVEHASGGAFGTTSTSGASGGSCGIDLVWALSPVSAAVWRAVCRTWLGDVAAVPVCVGGQEAVLWRLADGGGADIQGAIGAWEAGR